MKQKSPIAPGAAPVKPWGLREDQYDRMAPGLMKSETPLRGNLNVGYQSRFSSPGGKSTKPGPGMGSTVTGSSRRPDEMDRSSMPNAGRRSDVVRDDPDRLRRATVDRYADRKNLPDPMGGVRGGKSTEQLKGYAHNFPRALKDGQ
jgi:hypothetical protein